MGRKRLKQREGVLASQFPWWSHDWTICVCPSSCNLLTLLSPPSQGLPSAPGLPEYLSHFGGQVERLLLIHRYVVISLYTVLQPRTSLQTQSCYPMKGQSKLGVQLNGRVLGTICTRPWLSPSQPKHRCAKLIKVLRGRTRMSPSSLPGELSKGCMRPCCSGFCFPPSPWSQALLPIPLHDLSSGSSLLNRFHLLGLCNVCLVQNAPFLSPTESPSPRPASVSVSTLYYT